jgi:hypothetical protein
MMGTGWGFFLLLAGGKLFSGPKPEFEISVTFKARETKGDNLLTIRSGNLS